MPDARPTGRIGALAQRKVKEGIEGASVNTTDGKTHQGYKVSENDKELVLHRPGGRGELRAWQEPTSKYAATSAR